MPDRSESLRKLNLLRAVSIADFLLLLPLLYGVIADVDGISPIVGPIHGLGFLGMLYLCATGAGERRWGWWFPALVVVTGGPIGSLIGDVKVRRDLQRAATPPAAA